jgi:Outer membrane protein beta-barrel domain
VVTLRPRVTRAGRSRRRIALLTSAFVLVIVTPAWGQWYVDAGVSLSKPETADVDLQAGGQHFRLQDEILDCFPRWFVKVGYWAGRFGVEVQAIKSTPDLDTPLFVSQQVGADVDPDWVGALSIGITLLGRYPSEPDGAFVYAGVGAGATRATMREDNLNDVTVRPEFHVTVGAAIRLVNALWVTFEYQAGYTPQLEFHGGAAGRSRIAFDLFQHHALFGLMWMWR